MKKQSIKPTILFKLKPQGMVSISVILVGIVIGIIGYMIGIEHQQNTAVSVATKQHAFYSPTPTVISTATPMIVASSNDKDAIPYWSDPSGFYHIYSTCDSTSKCAVYVTTHENDQKIIKVLSLNDFHGSFDDPLWAPVDSYVGPYDSKFILKISGSGDGHYYYLLHTNGIPAEKLNLESTVTNYYEIIAWIDKDRVLIKHTVDDENTNAHITYAVAPIADLSQKKIVSF